MLQHHTILGFISFGGLLVIALILAAAAATAIFTVKRLLFVCQPNEVLIFSGRRRDRSDGSVAGYRIIRGGRALRIPLLETVDRMDLTNMIIEVTVRNAYSRGGIPLSVQGVANLKIPGEEPLLNNCLERFLGKPRQEIMKIARETLEGNLRGVLATLTPEQVNQDKESFAGQLAAEAEQDFDRLGLVLDTLKIQNVTDEVGYLDAIGRQRSASIRRDARVAEAIAEAESTEQKWHNTMNAELAKLTAEMVILEKDNERRVADARTKREALIARERADVQADIAQASAEIEMQLARVQQVRLQLQADVIEPAEAVQLEAIQKARGAAATVVEQGTATARVLLDLAKTYNQNPDAGRDVLLMQKLLPLLDQLSGTMGELTIDRMTVLGNSKTNAHGGDDATLANRIVSYSEQIKAATGIDIPEALKDRIAPAGPSAREPKPTP